MSDLLTGLVSVSDLLTGLVIESDLLTGLVIVSDLLTGLVSVRPTDRTGRGAAGRQRRARTLRTLAVRLSRRLLSHSHTGKLYTPGHSSK